MHPTVRKTVGMNRVCRKRCSLVVGQSFFALAFAEMFRGEGEQAATQTACSPVLARSKLFRRLPGNFSKGASPVHSSGGAFVFPYACLSRITFLCPCVSYAMPPHQPFFGFVLGCLAGLVGDRINCLLNAYQEGGTRTTALAELKQVMLCSLQRAPGPRSCCLS